MDRVSEVLNIADEDIEPAPSFGKEVQTDFILGIGKSHSKVKILLDIDCIITSDHIDKRRFGSFPLRLVKKHEVAKIVAASAGGSMHASSYK